MTGNVATGVPADSQGIYFDPNPTGATATSVFHVDGTDNSDVLATSPGTDQLSAGPGDDFFLVGNGSYLTSVDSLDGGTGHNTILFDSTTVGDTLVVGTNVVNVQEIDLVDPSTFQIDSVAEECRRLGLFERSHHHRQQWRRQPDRRLGQRHHHRRHRQ